VPEVQIGVGYTRELQEVATRPFVYLRWFRPFVYLRWFRPFVYLRWFRIRELQERGRLSNLRWFRMAVCLSQVV
jgi:hypothetical protein